MEDIIFSIYKRGCIFAFMVNAIGFFLIFLRRKLNEGEEIEAGDALGSFLYSCLFVVPLSWIGAFMVILAIFTNDRLR